MKRAILSLALVFTLSSIFGQSSKTIQSDRDSAVVIEIKNLEYHLASLIERGDIDNYSSYLADDYIRISANGSKAGKEEVLASLRKAKGQGKMFPYDLQVRIYGNTAILNAKLDLETRTGDTESKRSSIITKVFIKRNGKWFMVSLHGTALPDLRN